MATQATSVDAFATTVLTHPSKWEDRAINTDPPRCREHLLSILKSIVQHPSAVAVLQVEGYPFAFQIKVSAEDYQMVLSRLDVIRTLASSYAGLPEGQRIFIQMLPV